MFWESSEVKNEFLGFGCVELEVTAWSTRLDRKKDVSVLACKLLRTIYFTHEDFGDQADDECLKLLNKNQTVQMSHVLNWKELHIKERDYSLFCAKKETDVKNSTLWSTGFGMA